VALSEDGEILTLDEIRENRRYLTLVQGDLKPWKCWIRRDEIKFAYHPPATEIAEKVTEHPVLLARRRIPPEEIEEEQYYRRCRKIKAILVNVQSKDHVQSFSVKASDFLSPVSHSAGAHSVVFKDSDSGQPITWRGLVDGKTYVDDIPESFTNAQRRII
jgi:hypothetical protein